MDSEDDYYHDDDDDNYYSDEDEEERKSDDQQTTSQAGKNYNYHCYEESFQRQQIINNIESIQDNIGLSFGQALYIYKDNNYNLEKSKNASLQKYEQKIIQDTVMQEECQLCFGDEDLYSQSCGHKFCADCYRQYLEVIIKQGDDCILKKCPMEGCKMILDRETFKKFLSRKDYDMYITLLYNDYVQVSKFILPCYRTNCSYVLKLFNENLGFEDKQDNLKCQCNYRYCSLCKKQPHRPVSCERLVEWTELLGGANTEDLNEAWIKLNSKKCPNCKVDIEKNQGCMHMTCRKCRHDFCWLCLQSWRNHSNCNKYNEDNKSKSESQKKLEKYTFYSDRYIQHKKSVKLAETRKKEMMEQLDNILTVIPSEQLKRENVEEGLELIIECRLAITYSYALGYYIDEKKRSFFEFQQGNLESNLEILDKYMQDIDFQQYYVELQQDYASTSKKVYTFNKELKDLANTIKNYFSTMLNDFEKELPQCQESKNDFIMFPHKQNSKKGGKNKPSKEEQLSEEQQLKMALKLSQQQFDYELRKESSTGQYWRCKKCTFNNHNTQSRTCQMCSNKR